jgi:WD40 repeat protein
MLAISVAIAAILVGGLAQSSTAASRQGELWLERYNGTGNGYDRAVAVAASPDGSRVFVTGYSRGVSGLDDWGTVAYEAATGVAVWARRYNGPAHSYDQASAIVVSPDGSWVFVTGYSDGHATANDYLTIAYDATTGVSLWTRRYNGPGNITDIATAVAISPDGSKVFVTGYSAGATTGADWATIAYNASTGALLWLKRYNGPGNSDDEAHAVLVSPDGSKVFVTGFTYEGPSDDDYATAAYDGTTGVTLWARRYNGPGNFIDRAVALAGSPDGSKVFVTGYSQGVALSMDYATLAYDAATGAPLWLTRYSAGTGDDFGTAVVASPDGSSVFVTGYSLGSNGFDYVTLAYNSSTGGQAWLARYNGPSNGDDFALSIAVGADGGKVFVTGYSRGATNASDYATLAYDAPTGAQAWLERYNGPDNLDDQAYAVTSDPDGSKVFVTGASKGITSDFDYATVAYPA